MPAILPAFIWLGGSALIPFIKGRARQVYVLAIALISLIDVFMLKIQSSWVVNYIGFKVTLLHVDRVSLFVGYIFAFISVMAVLYTVHVDETWHHLLAFWYVGSAFGAVFAGDLLSFYLFWELMVIGSAGLVFLNKNDEEAKWAGYRYLLMHLIGGAVLIGGIFLHYMQTHSLAIGPLPVGTAAYLMLFGVGMNSAWLLLHTWLPDAYPKALYTGSIFMSVYTTKTAVYALVRFAPGWNFVAYMGASMAVFGVTMALVQGNPRKLLSYHIVSQVGYMVAGIGLGGALGVNGGLMHLFNNILYKTLLFMAIGAVIYRTGKNDLTEMGGVARKMPVTTIAALIAAMSISGFPLFAGFISKSMIFEATEGNQVIELMLELAAVGTFLSFLKFTYFGFIRPNKTNEAKATEAPLNMTIAMGCVAAVCVAVGVVPQLFMRLLPYALPATETSFYVVPKLAGILQILAMTGVLFFFALAVFSPHKRRTFDFDWFYIQAGKGLQHVAEGFSWTNNTVEAATAKIVPAIMSLKPAVYKINELMGRMLFAVFVDMWLYKPVTPSVASALSEAEAKKRKKKETHVIEDLARLGERTSILVGKIDLGIIDKLIGKFAELGEYISRLTGIFDIKVVDGAVNGVAWLTQKAGKGLRPIQTGDVQSYGVMMVGGAVFALVFIVLVFYGILVLT